MHGVGWLEDGAHPRSRGENWNTVVLTACIPGSSPLTRGKLGLHQGVNVSSGLIPAHAGKTAGWGCTQCFLGAHPRSRGENIVDKPNILAGLGSSPLTRGKPCCSLTTLVSIGLIPAHAGKTIGARTWPPPRPAHPRSRGENWATCVRRSKQGGSSPLTRGKLGECRGVDGPGGLIPAHAGKTFGPYPADDREAGSSPLTRGKRGQERGCYFVEGLIPAHAGKTPRTTRRSASRKAHPRSRGENGLGETLLDHLQGSSPLTRGKPWRAFRRRSDRGLIPAHAGKTWRENLPAAGAGAHPRSRGENTFICQTSLLSAGSSPLTRGKLRRVRLD